MTERQFRWVMSGLYAIATAVEPSESASLFLGGFWLCWTVTALRAKRGGDR